MTGQVLFVESIIVHLHLGEGAKIVRHEHDGRMHVLQLTHRVIHAPHEDREEGVAGTEQLSLRVFHFEAFSLGGGLALQKGGRLAHAGCFLQQLMLLLATADAAASCNS